MNFAPMLVYIAVSCFTPGPNNLMVMYLSARYGFKGSYKFMTASCICFLLKMLICGALNLALASAIPAAVPYLKWIGVAYMLYLAINIFLNGYKKQGEREETSPAESTYRSGILLQVLNIKSWVFALSVFSIYVVPFTNSTGDIFICSLLSTAAMVVATLLWALCGQGISKLYNKHIRICSVLMVLSLVWCAATLL